MKGFTNRYLVQGSFIGMERKLSNAVYLRGLVGLIRANYCDHSPHIKGTPARSTLLMTLPPGRACRTLFCEKYTNEKVFSDSFECQSFDSLRNIHTLLISDWLESIK